MFLHISKKWIYNLLLTALFLNGCISNSNKFEDVVSESKITHEPLMVTYFTLTPVSFHEEIISNGKIHAYSKAELHFNTSGSIQKINYRNGEKVKSGAIIAFLDNRSQKIAISMAQNQFETAKLELSSLMLGYGGKDGDSASIPSDVYTSLKVLSGYKQAQNGLQSARLQYDYTIIKAPFSGILADIEVQAHNMISANDVFCHLIDNTKFTAEFPVIEKELSLIYLGQKVKVIPFATDNLVLEGSISEINPSVDEHGLARVKAIIPQQSNKVFEGMNVKIIVQKEIINQLVIPKEALVLRSNKEVVFTYKNGLARWNYVKVSNENSSSYVISEGLTAGDLVIVSGNLNLAHDAKVKIKDN